MSRDIIQYSWLKERIDVSLFDKGEARVKCTSVSLSWVHTWEVSTFMHIFVLRPYLYDFKPTASD